MTVRHRIDPATRDTLAELLDEADHGPVEVLRGRYRYRLERSGSVEPNDEHEERIDSDWDLRRFQPVIGTWADVDASSMVADIYRWRPEGSRGLDRPYCSI